LQELSLNSDHAKKEGIQANSQLTRMPYENSHIELSMGRSVEIIELKPPYIEPISNEQLIEAIRNPVASPPLPEIVGNKNNVLIIIENATRPLNTPLIASLVIEELHRCGVADKHITFLFANGAHKEMDECNFKRKLGEQFKDFKVVNHDCEGPLVNLGATSLGSPILVNPLVLEADVKIAIGTIEPHYGDGVSGGAKILFPGCAGLDWIFNNHSLERGQFGQVDNEWRKDTEESAAKVGIDFLINAVLNYKREIVGLYCGHWIEAHRAGAALAMKASKVELPYKADFCIAGSSPFDLNFIQSLKGIDVVKTIVEEGGAYVMLTSCLQGLGNHRWLLDERMAKTRRYQGQNNNSAVTEIIYSTHLSEAELHSYCPQQVRLIDDINELKRVVESFDRPGSRGIVLPYAPITTLFASGSCSDTGEKG